MQKWRIDRRRSVLDTESEKCLDPGLITSVTGIDEAMVKINQQADCEELAR